jgi:hypothetical protein
MDILAIFGHRRLVDPASRPGTLIIVLLGGIGLVVPARAEMLISEFGVRMGISNGGSDEDFTMY